MYKASMPLNLGIRLFEKCGYYLYLKSRETGRQSSSICWFPHSHTHQQQPGCAWGEWAGGCKKQSCQGAQACHSCECRVLQAAPVPLLVCLQVRARVEPGLGQAEARSQEPNPGFPLGWPGSRYFSHMYRPSEVYRNRRLKSGRVGT